MILGEFERRAIPTLDFTVQSGTREALWPVSLARWLCSIVPQMLIRIRRELLHINHGSTSAVRHHIELLNQPCTALFRLETSHFRGGVMPPTNGENRSCFVSSGLDCHTK
jgi:hypothetical protein